MMRRLKRAASWVGVVVAVAVVAGVVWLRPTWLPAFDAAAYRDLGDRYDVRILRDDFGVPHIYGRRDEDVAFGLAYAHAEDDFATLQQSLMTSRGQLGRIDGQMPHLLNAVAGALGLPAPMTVEGTDPAVSDYLVALLRVRERVRVGLPRALAAGQVAPKTMAVLQGYADGINLYAARHPREVVHGFEAVKAEDLVSGVPLGAVMGVVAPPGGGRGGDKAPKPFVVGASIERRAERDGVLYLKVNVPPGSKVTGKFTAEISGVTLLE